MEHDLRPIPGYPHYLADKNGGIWTLKRKGGNDRGAGRLGDPRPLTMHTNGAGYQVVNLDCGGKNSTRQVHRLILLAFVGEPPAGFQACHYPDSTRSNNRLENLRWDSVAENMKDKYRDSPISPTKKCTTCGTTKNRSDFYADVRNVDGIKAECKPCHTKTGMETRDPEKKRTNNRVWMRDVYRERNLSP